MLSNHRTDDSNTRFQYAGRFFHCHPWPFRTSGEGRNVVVIAQALNTSLIPSFVVTAMVAKSIKSSSYMGVRLNHCQLSNQFHDILIRGIGVVTDFILADLQFRMHTADPMDLHLDHCTAVIDIDDDFIDERSNDSLLQFDRCGNIVPYGMQMGAQSKRAIALLFAQRYPGLRFGLKTRFGLRDLSQRRIPPCFQLRSDEPIGRINGIELALSALGLIANSL